MLTETCRDAAKVYDQRAASEPSAEMQAYWTGEAAQARALEALLKKTISVELEVIEASPAMTVPPSAAANSHATLQSGAASLYSHRVKGSPDLPAPQAAHRESEHKAAAPAATVPPAAEAASLPVGHGPELSTRRQQLAQCLAGTGYQTEAGCTATPDAAAAPSLSETPPSAPMSSAVDSCADPSSTQPVHKSALEAWHSASPSLPLS